MTKTIEQHYWQMTLDTEVARMLGVSVKQVWSWAERGQIEGVFKEGRWWIGRMELIRFSKEWKRKKLEEQDRRRAEEIEEIRQRALADAPKIDF